MFFKDKVVTYNPKDYEHEYSRDQKEFNDRVIGGHNKKSKGGFANYKRDYDREVEEAISKSISEGNDMSGEDELKNIAEQDRQNRSRSDGNGFLAWFLGLGKEAKIIMIVISGIIFFSAPGFFIVIIIGYIIYANIKEQERKNERMK